MENPQVSAKIPKWGPSRLLFVFAVSFCFLFTSFEGRREGQRQVAAAPESCHLRELELCAVGAAALFQNPNGIPLTGVEFERQCEYLEESMDCFSEYAETCLDNTQRGIVGLFGGDLHKLQQQFCKEGTELRRNYTKHGQCFREVQRKFQHQCVTDLQVGFESIHKLDLSRRMSTFCCNVNRFKSCIMDKIEDNCGIEALSFVENIIRQVASNAISNLCRAYDDDFDGCKKFLPEPGTKPYPGRNTSAISRVVSAYANARA